MTFNPELYTFQLPISPTFIHVEFTRLKEAFKTYVGTAALGTLSQSMYQQLDQLFYTWCIIRHLQTITVSYSQQLPESVLRLNSFFTQVAPHVVQSIFYYDGGRDMQKVQSGQAQGPWPNAVFSTPITLQTGQPLSGSAGINTAASAAGGAGGAGSPLSTYSISGTPTSPITSAFHHSSSSHGPQGSQPAPHASQPGQASHGSHGAQGSDSKTHTTPPEGKKPHQSPQPLGQTYVKLLNVSALPPVPPSTPILAFSRDDNYGNYSYPRNDPPIQALWLQARGINGTGINKTAKTIKNGAGAAGGGQGQAYGTFGTYGGGAGVPNGGACVPNAGGAWSSQSRVREKVSTTSSDTSSNTSTTSNTSSTSITSNGVAGSAGVVGAAGSGEGKEGKDGKSGKEVDAKDKDTNGTNTGTTKETETGFTMETETTLNALDALATQGELYYNVPACIYSHRCKKLDQGLECRYLHVHLPEEAKYLWCTHCEVAGHSKSICASATLLCSLHCHTLGHWCSRNDKKRYWCVLAENRHEVYVRGTINCKTFEFCADNSFDGQENCFPVHVFRGDILCPT